MHPVARPQMLDEKPTVFPWRVMKAKRRRVVSVDKDQALQAAH
jgi:hypothetical protein